MIVSFGDWKLQLIQDILSLKKEQSLKKIASEIAVLKEQEADISEQELALKAAVRPTRKTITIEQMIEEQNYRPIKREDFYKKTAQLKIEEPLEDLLNMLD